MPGYTSREEKVAAARKKLQKFQKQKGIDKVKVSDSRQSTPEQEGCNIEKSGGSSACSTPIDSLAMECDANNEDNEPGVAENYMSYIIHDGVSLESVTNNVSNNTENYSVSNCIEVLTSSESVDDILYGTDESTSQRTDFSPPNSAVIVPLLKSSAFKDATNSSSDYEHDGSVSSETNATVTTAIYVTENMYSEPAAKSTTESLRQLSLQISGLVNDAESKELNGSEMVNSELEKRNEELAGLLSEEKCTSMQQSQVIEELKLRLQSKDSELNSLRSVNVVSSGGGLEVQGLREQLQIHIQTIGILVAEKSELQSSLGHTRHSLELRTGEVTELQGRLDASRHHVRELESSIQNLESRISTINDTSQNNSEQFSSLQQKYSTTSKQYEELRATAAELNERLSSKCQENIDLVKKMDEMRSKLELANIHLQQLRDNTKEDLTNQFNQLQLSFGEAQNKINFLNSTLEQTEQEKTTLEHQYKSYANQLSVELIEQKDKLGLESSRLEEVQAANEELRKTINELQAQNAHTEKTNDLQTDIETIKINLQQAQQENIRLIEKCSSLERDNGQLSQMFVEQREAMERMEAAVDRKATVQVDTQQLLQSMQSDKIAAARALSQNKQLKEQLEELQNGFIMMSNKKLEVTEKLEVELHSKKGLCKEIADLGEQISFQQHALLSKDRELLVVKGNRQNMAASNSEGGENLPQKGFISPEIIDKTVIKVEVATQAESSIPENSNEQNHIKPNGVVDQDCKADVQTGYQPSTESITSISSRKSPHEALEERFTRCMRDLATATDEKQRSEHIVQQLQLETEAVGDYITIYQFQRGVMKKQMEELNGELHHLRVEKQQLFLKLAALQNLTKQLVSEKGTSQEKLLSGLYSNLNTTGFSKENGVSINSTEVSANSVSPANGNIEQGALEVQESLSANDASNKTENSTTVRKIMDLIKEMEHTTQNEFSVLNNFHPCQLCSGQLINI